MGRPKTNPDIARTAWVQIRCNPAWRDQLAGLATQAGYPDVATMFEALVAKEARRVKRPPLPPR